MNGLKIIFAGTPDFAAQHLRALLDNKYNVQAVFTQPDRPSGRGKKIIASPVKALALEKGIPVYQPLSLRGEDVQLELAEFNADLLVVVAYGLILPKAVLVIPRYGCINVHASLLPRWRGAAPVQRAIEAGDRRSGITIMQMDEGLDTGPVLSRVGCDIGATDTAEVLQQRLADIGVEALLDILPLLSNGLLKPKKQDETQATYASKITKEEAGVDWHQSAVAISRKIRAFNPMPVAHTTVKGNKLGIWQAMMVGEEYKTEPGKIIAADERGILVACGKAALLLTEVQLAGKRRMAAAEAARGHTRLLTAGAIFDSQPVC